MLCCWMVCLYIVVGLTYSRSPVFNTRDAVLFRAPEPPGFVRQTPEAPALIAFRRHLGDLIQPTASSLETARALRTWSYRQQPHTWDMLNGGDGEDSVDPELLLAQQQRGVPGACRRFAYVYLGALLSAGLNARVVNWDSSFYDRDPRAHSLVEVWIEELHRWVMMDAMSDQESLVDGRPASLIEPSALMDACTSPSRGTARRRQWGAFVRPVRVLHVLAPAEAGGLERVVESLAAGLQAHGEEHHVAAVLDRRVEHPMVASLRAASVTVHPLLIPPRAYRAERTAIESLCRQVHPDTVHTHGYRADVVDAPVARRLGIRTISTVHGFTGGGWRNRTYELLQRIALRQFDLVVAVARPLAVHLARIGVPAARIRMVPNAWCPDQVPLSAHRARATLGVPRNRFHLGWVGRLSWEKGADILLEAVAQLKDLPISVSVLGDGAERPALEGQARRLGIGSLVTWRGTLPAASRFFPGFDAFAITSRTEGTPIVLFEAMSSGVPVVAVAVGGIPDVVSDNEAALVPPRNPAALANALRGLYQAPHIAARRAAGARARLSEHDELSWLHRYRALYHSLRQPSRLMFSQEVVGMAPTALAGFPRAHQVGRSPEW